MYIAYVATLVLSANSVRDEKLASNHDWAAFMHLSRVSEFPCAESPDYVHCSFLSVYLNNFHFWA